MQLDDERYTIDNLIYQDNLFAMYQGHQNETNKAITIKILKEDQRTPKHVALMKHDFHVTHQLESQAILPPLEFIDDGTHVALVSEATDGILLSEWLKAKVIPVEEFLPLALLMAKSLAQIHDKHIIHKNINPNTILYCPKENNIRILDFSFSTPLSRETSKDMATTMIEGVMNYISPEQTGRMNTSIDQRSDLYSLGVIFYKMLTGVMPFQEEDLLSLIHAHMAIMPIAPNEVNKAVPKGLANIILKLMEKNLLNRYQTAYGLVKDLEHCQALLKTKAKIGVFPLGSKDISITLQLSTKIYGRDEQIKTLIDTYQAMLQGKKQLSLIPAVSGIGKTRLVQEIYKLLGESHGLFIQGKFDQIHQNLPYAAIAQAFRSWVKQLIVNEGDKVQALGKKLTETLAPNGQLILNIIPKLELIMGPQPPLPKVNPAQERARWEYTMELFLETVATSANPLVLFLDDLQWADKASLRFIKLLLTSQKVNWVYVILAYRSNEVDSTHPLHSMLDKLNGSIISNSISLSTLTEADCSQWLSDSLTMQHEAIQPLVNLCYEKSGGNPFYFEQFIENSYNDRLLYFQSSEGTWSWTLEGIQQQTMTDNVLDLMVKSIQRLDEEAQQLLILAACIGNHFDLGCLVKVSESSFKALTKRIWKILESGLILPENNDYKLLDELATDSIEFYFVHDRVQEAAYSLMSESKRQATHLVIARHLLQRHEGEMSQEQLFLIVNQYNNGMNLVKEKQEQLKLSELNQEASKKALNATAYSIAKTYAEKSLSLLGESPWTTEYKRVKALKQLLMETHLQTHQTQKVFELFKEMDHALASPLEKYPVYILQMQSYQIENKMKEAMTIGLTILQQLGLSLPKEPKKYHVAKMLLKVKWKIRGKSMADLENIPIMTNEKKIALLRVLSEFHFPAYNIYPLFYPLGCLHRMVLFLDYGYQPECCYAIANYGAILIGLREYKKAYAFGSLAMRLVERNPMNKYANIAKIVHQSRIMDLEESTKKVHPLLLEGFYALLSSGEIKNAVVILSAYCMYRASYLYKDVSLSEQLKQLQQFRLDIDKYHDEDTNTILDEITMSISHIMGKTTCSKAYLQEEVKTDAAVTIGGFYNSKLYQALLFQQDYEALAIFRKLTSDWLSVVKLGGSSWCHMYISYYLALANNYSKLTKKEKHFFSKIMKESDIEKRKALNPKEIETGYQLMLAEQHRIRGDYAACESYYNLAIDAANKSNANFYLYLTCLQAAKFQLHTMHNKTLAKMYLQIIKREAQATEAYGLLRSLEKNFAEVFTQTDITSSATDVETTITEQHYQSLDLAAIIKINQSISSEVVLEKLMNEMLKILAKDLGAQTAIFVDKSQDNKSWDVEAICQVDEGKITTNLIKEPLNKTKSLPRKLVRYVINSGETILSDNLTQEANFNDDNYIIKYQPRSVICHPIKSKNKLIAIIYLENNLLQGAFTKNSMAILSMISAQIAISFENAKHLKHVETLYHATERFVPKRFLELLHKEHVEDVTLGDAIEMKVTVLFSDIRSYTTITEKQTPKEAFNFINEYLHEVAPIIRKHHGFINQYQGDAVMALFPREPKDAILAVKEMSQKLEDFNVNQQAHQQPQIKVGYGLNTGIAIMGTIGEEGRMEPNVISDAINLAARVESLTKDYGVTFLVTDNTLKKVPNGENLKSRVIDRVKVKGKEKPVLIYGMPLKELTEQERSFNQIYESAFKAYENGDIKKARMLFMQCQQQNQQDKPTQILIERLKLSL